MGPEGRERLPRISKRGQTLLPAHGLWEEMLEPDRISGSLFLARATERQSGRALSQRCGKVLLFPTICSLPRFRVSLPAGSPGRFAQAHFLCAANGLRLGPWSSELRKGLRQRDNFVMGHLSEPTGAAFAVLIILFFPSPWWAVEETLGLDHWISFWCVCFKTRESRAEARFRLWKIVDISSTKPATQR